MGACHHSCQSGPDADINFPSCGRCPSRLDSDELEVGSTVKMPQGASKPSRASQIDTVPEAYECTRQVGADKDWLLFNHLAKSTADNCEWAEDMQKTFPDLEPPATFNADASQPRLCADDVIVHAIHTPRAESPKQTHAAPLLTKPGVGVANLRGWRMRFRAAAWAGIPKFHCGRSPDQVGIKELRPSGNNNRPQDYKWLYDAICSVLQQEANSVGAVDTDTGNAVAPVFFVIGACPNFLCGMQAVGYFESGGALDFWWVKPSKTNPAQIERATLDRHSRGLHKNDPGRSRQFYKPIADLFQFGEVREGWRFGLERVRSVRGKEAPRAFLSKFDGSGSEDLDAGATRRFYVHLFWQEDWTNNPWARSKYIKGKIIYQKVLAGSQCFSRQYEIHDGAITISEYEEVFTGVLPPDDVKRLWDLSTTPAAHREG